MSKELEKKKSKNIREACPSFPDRYKDHEVLKVNYPYPGFILCGNPEDGYYCLEDSDEKHIYNARMQCSDEEMHWESSSFSISEYEKEYWKQKELEDESTDTSLLE